MKDVDTTNKRESRPIPEATITSSASHPPLFGKHHPPPSDEKPPFAYPISGLISPIPRTIARN